LDFIRPESFGELHNLRNNWETADRIIMIDYGSSGLVRVALLIGLHGFFCALPAQNLILDPGFEERQVPAAHFPQASPDLLSLNAPEPSRKLPHSVFGWISPQQGRSIMGASLWNRQIPDFREYLSLELSEPLEEGETYTCSFYLANGRQAAGGAGGYGIAGIGVFFSEEKPVQQGAAPLSAAPQFRIEGTIYSHDWMQIRFSFVAEGDYLFLTAGNFENDAMTQAVVFSATTFPSAYYFFDSFELVKGIPADPPAPEPAPAVGEVETAESQAPEEESCPVFIPTAFSPNGDGVNDIFKVHSACPLAGLRMQVFDRSGRQVFSSTDPFARWDGLGAAAGSYLYRIEATVQEGEHLHKRVFTGPISLK
jgi:gliding motility-associated-like protein